MYALPLCTSFKSKRFKERSLTRSMKWLPILLAQTANVELCASARHIGVKSALNSTVATESLIIRPRGNSQRWFAIDSLSTGRPSFERSLWRLVVSLRPRRKSKPATHARRPTNRLDARHVGLDLFEDLAQILVFGHLARRSHFGPSNDRNDTRSGSSV